MSRKPWVCCFFVVSSLAACSPPIQTFREIQVVYDSDHWSGLFMDARIRVAATGIEIPVGRILRVDVQSRYADHRESSRREVYVESNDPTQVDVSFVGPDEMDHDERREFLIIAYEPGQTELVVECDTDECDDYSCTRFECGRIPVTVLAP